MQTGEDECEFGGKEAFKVKGGLTVKGALGQLGSQSLRIILLIK